MILQIQMRIGWLTTTLMLVLAVATTWSQSQSQDQSKNDYPISKDGCQDVCGDVRVPYPFGLNNSNNDACALNEYFLLNCTQGGELFLGKGIPVRNISSLNGTITISMKPAYGCYNSRGNLTQSFRRSPLTLNSNRTFTFSDTENIFTAIGCDTSGTVTNVEGTFGAACLSLCTNDTTMYDNNTCSGSGCCQTSIPKGIRSLRISIRSVNNHTNISQFNPCGYAFLAERNSLKLSQWPLSRLPSKDGNMVNLVLEWVPKPKSKTKVEGCAICGTNTSCYYSDNAKGYRCSCKPGFRGNPYLDHGCRDINECESSPCHGKCRNTPGNYICSCPLGMYGDARTGCGGLSIQIIFVVAGAIIAVVIIAILLYIACLRRSRDRNFRENGGTVLRNQRVRIFTEVELKKATKNYDDSLKLGEGGFGSVYEGILTDNTRIAVKKAKVLDKQEESTGDFQQEMAMVSQVNHKNVVQLLGMCLETKVPLLVYEYISNGNLSEHIHKKRSQILDTWKNRLRIAAETALALDYLHSLANPPMIHGDIKPVNILLDDTYTAKIADFGASVLVSLEEPDVATQIKGTFGYLDPEYLMTGILSSKSDVYSFGIVLLELLAGEKPNRTQNIIHNFISKLESDRLPEILCFQVADDSEMDEVEEVAYLAKRCVNASAENRPSMNEVSEELARLMRPIHEKSLRREKSEESQRLLGDHQSPSNSFSIKNLRASLSKCPSYSVIPLEIESYSGSI